MNMSVADRIKQSRKEQGLTQKELGERLDVSQATVQQYESGKRNPKLVTLSRIATALRIPISCLLDISALETPRGMPSDVEEGAR